MIIIWKTKIKHFLSLITCHHFDTNINGLLYKQSINRIKCVFLARASTTHIKKNNTRTTHFDNGQMRVKKINKAQNLFEMIETDHMRWDYRQLCGWWLHIAYMLTMRPRHKLKKEKKNNNNTIIRLF